ncbi:hypothetical protein DFH11DRAFT_1743174 [Phellopilus nigrolimitatus]|nr:hypothetical protein DFH11DRAFT_1743174 [Phellopilus nigrolimitatus]
MRWHARALDVDKTRRWHAHGDSKSPPPSHLHDTAAVRQDPHAQQLTTPPSDAVDSTTTTTRMRGHALLLDGTPLRKHALSDNRRQCRKADSSRWQTPPARAHPAAGAAANAVHDTRVVRAAHSPARRGALLNPKANRGKRTLDAPHARCEVTSGGVLVGW